MNPCCSIISTFHSIFIIRLIWCILTQSQVYGTAVLSPAHALKSTFGIEELAQATLWFLKKIIVISYLHMD